jgi:hypothetical protein
VTGCDGPLDRIPVILKKGTFPFLPLKTGTFGKKMGHDKILIKTKNQ